MPTDAQINDFRETAAMLQALGLGELFTVDRNGRPGGWLWQQILSGNDTEEEIATAIESTDVWKDRFQVIVAQRDRAAKGEPGRVWDVQDVVRYEEQVKSVMRRYDLPPWFYDQPSDFADLILNDLSADEVESRITNAYDSVANVDPEIRRTFRDFYGVGQGDAALAAYFLNPDITEAQLDRQALGAYAGGIARGFDVELNRNQAELFGDLGFTERGITDTLQNIAATRDVLSEGFTETTDLTDETAFDAIVRGDAASQAALEQRVIRRRAVNQTSQGGALLTQEGLLGIGTAQ